MNPDDLITLATEFEGQKIEEKYYLIKRLGLGQYGVVFLADEVDQQKCCPIRQVAVKLIPPFDNNEQELQISPSLQHPHVLRCFTSGQNKLEKNFNLDDGQNQPKQIQYLYLVMELADKDEETLEKYFKKRGILSEAETWDLVESLVSALVYFSELSPRLVHRDLKPANVLRVGGKWKIADFGIVRLVKEDILSTIHPMATPAYAPPEFYDNTVCNSDDQLVSVVSRTFDMWSLGVMIVEMLTGQLPFLAPSEKQLQIVVMNDEPKIVLPLPSPFPEIVKGCLEKDHKKRLTAEQLEVEFIIQRLVGEVWKPETETEKAQTEKAIQTVKEFRPKLKGKTNAPNIMLRYILKMSRFQHPLLTQLLEWVCDAQSIPVEGEEQWIDQLVRSHIKDWNAQELAEYLDFDVASNFFWLGLKQKYDNPFALVDDFLAKRNWGDEEKIKKINEIIDEYKLANYHRDGATKDEPHFQRLISSSLNHKFYEAQKTMPQAELDQLLNSIVEDSSAIEAIAIITLTKSGGIEYYNKKLKSSKPEIYQALFGRRDASDAIAEFDKLPGIPKAFNTFGEVTSYGTLEYAMFYMTQGLVIVYFIDLPGIPVGICFISTQEANFAPFCRQCRAKIDELTKKVKGALQEV